MGGVGGESLLFGHECFQPVQHGVEGISEVAELVTPTWQGYPVGEGAGPHRAGGVSDAGERGEHPAGQQPTSQNPEDQQEYPQDDRGRSEIAQEAAAVRRYEDRGAMDQDRLTPRHVSQEERPHRPEQQAAGDHEEAGVAEGEFEANTPARASIHGLPLSAPVSGRVSMR